MSPTSSRGSRSATSSPTPSTPTPPWPSSTGSPPNGAPSPSSSACDNGPELTAYALRDWCRFSGAGTSYIDPGSPWQNPWVESYGSRMRDELLAIEQFDSLLEAQVLVADWREEYNTYRPHSATRHAHACPSSPSGGGPTSFSSHSGWTDQRGPVSGSPFVCRQKCLRHKTII